jgi:hypothetical protein
MQIGPIETRIPPKHGRAELFTNNGKLPLLLKLDAEQSEANIQVSWEDDKGKTGPLFRSGILERGKTEYLTTDPNWKYFLAINTSRDFAATLTYTINILLPMVMPAVPKRIVGVKRAVKK